MIWIQYWNAPHMIYFIIPLFIGMMFFALSLIWKKSRSYEVACTLTNMPRHSPTPVIWRIAVVCLSLLAVITLFLMCFSSNIILWNFIIATTLCFIFMRLILSYGMHLIKKYHFYHERIDRNLTRITHCHNKYRPYVLICAFLCLILALMQPQGKEQTTLLLRNSLKTTIVFDLSRSMDATDYVPSRFSAARDEIVRLLKASHGDQIGLIFFTHELVASIPQTFDTALLTAVLNEMDPSQLTSRGTDLNVALQAALNAFDENIDFQYEKEDNGRRRVLLVTDGEDHSEDITQTIQKLIDRHIHVDIIAVGTENGSEIPDAQNHPMQFENAPVISKIQTPFLENLAQQTGGSLARLTTPDSATSDILAHWNLVRIDMTPQKAHSSFYREPLYIYFLVPGYILIALFFFYPLFVYWIDKLQLLRRKTSARRSDRTMNPKDI